MKKCTNNVIKNNLCNSTATGIVSHNAQTESNTQTQKKFYNTRVQYRTFGTRKHLVPAFYKIVTEASKENKASR